MTTLQAAIEIDAPPIQVWQILTNVAAYTEWNPFIKEARGEVRPGATLQVRIQPPGSGALTFRPTVRRVRPNRELSWLGRLLVPGLLDGEHSFELEPLDYGRTRFVQRETFTGLLVPLLRRWLEGNTLRGFRAMNLALKHRAERQVAAYLDLPRLPEHRLATPPRIPVLSPSAAISFDTVGHLHRV